MTPGTISSGKGRTPGLVKATEGLFDDRILYVTVQGSRLGIEGGRIVVSWPDKTGISSVPMDHVETINVFGTITVSTPFLRQCSKEGVTVNYFSIYGKYSGSFVPVTNTIALVRRHQYGLSEGRALSIARAIVRAKVRNSRTFLARKKIAAPDRLKELEVATEGASDLDHLRGIEGEGAQIYFSLLGTMLIDGWGFETRSRRPPKDNENSLLSLTYGMVRNEVLGALRQCNLDPFIGVMHTDRHGRPALALDLIEEFRPIFCDAFSVRLLNHHVLDHDDFREDHRLKEPALKRYLESFDGYIQEEFNDPRFKYTVSRRKAILLQAMLLRKAIVGALEGYHPLIFPR